MVLQPQESVKKYAENSLIFVKFISNLLQIWQKFTNCRKRQKMIGQLTV